MKLSEELFDWIKWYWSHLPNRTDNGLRFNWRSYSHLPWNQWFHEQLVQLLAQEHPQLRPSHVFFFSDYKPGGVHTDGYIASPEDAPLGRTFLFPIEFEDPNCCTIVFNQSSEEAVTLNAQLGLGNLGVRTYRQVTSTELLLDTNVPFDKDVHEKYLPHLSYDHLSGFTVKDIHFWQVGEAISWQRSMFHTSGFFKEGTTRKAMVIITNETSD